MIPKRKATLLTVVNLIHCRRVRRRDLLAKGRLPCRRPPHDLPTFKQLLKTSFFDRIYKIYRIKKIK
ncbi:MAG: hypothetical protein LBK82_17830 [Planctomycetaceae bacterium]|nr:hypothetical protein [Planctomycetaceae bacterium]